MYNVQVMSGKMQLTLAPCVNVNTNCCNYLGNRKPAVWPTVCMLPLQHSGGHRTVMLDKISFHYHI